MTALLWSMPIQTGIPLIRCMEYVRTCNLLPTPKWLSNSIVNKILGQTKNLMLTHYLSRKAGDGSKLVIQWVNVS